MPPSTQLLKPGYFPQTFPLALTFSPCAFGLLNLFQIWALFTLTVTALAQAFNVSYGNYQITFLVGSQSATLSSFLPCFITCYFSLPNTLRTLKGPHMIYSLQLLCVCTVCFFHLFPSTSHSLVQASVSRKPSLSQVDLVTPFSQHLPHCMVIVFVFAHFGYGKFCSYFMLKLECLILRALVIGS